MSTLWTVLGIIAGIVVLLVVFWASVYNRLVRLRNWSEESFSQVDVQLQRRNDLIPNLVETVKGYSKHESETLDAVVKARQQIVNLPMDATPEQKNELSNQLTGALSRLLAVAEAYPELKANQNYLDLQRSLEETEDLIAKARQIYNSSIGQYNTGIQTFPNSLVAGLSGFAPKAYLQAPAEAKEAPNLLPLYYWPTS